VHRIRESVRYRGRRRTVQVIAGPYTRRLKRRARHAHLENGVTVVTVNFNTLDYLKIMVEGIRLHSDPRTKILVVDNASTDGSRDWLKAQKNIDTIRLPVNANHGPAMDVGILSCRTSHFVALDVDAFPISNDWIPELLGPLESGCEVSGASIPWTHLQSYVHACCLAMRTKRFVEMDHTFAPGPDWDTAQRISQREFPRIHTFHPTSSRGPAAVGTVFGGMVYHNFYSARFKTTDRDRIEEDEDLFVERADPEVAWEEAVTRYFPQLG
jgi:glycosyltransferase involved in cell wall biosynthesis